jgi:ABC-type sugar transport system ATPase subunit
MPEKQLLSIEGLSKRYPGVLALDDVSITLNRGEVHGLVGANGAGKSTLIKVLAGAVQPDKGSIYLNGERVIPLSPKKSQDIGIQVIHQELNLVPKMSVMENIFLGYEITSNKIILNDREMRAASTQILDTLGVKIPPDIPLGALSVSFQQMVAVAAALRRNAIILILDETTAAITGEEMDHLFGRVKNLRDKGLGIIFVSHQIDEIFQICDRVSILRDGKYIATKDVKNTSKAEIISLMVGTKISDEFPKGVIKKGDVVLSIEKLSQKNTFTDVSFDIKKGEVVGFFGLVGAGRTELFKTIFGITRPTSGSIILNGVKKNIKKPSEAVRLGLGFLPEDRKREGLLLKMSVLHNITLPSLHKLLQFGMIQSDKEKNLAKEQVKNLNIITPTLGQKVMFLSGGNQQKVILAKWLAIKPTLLILDQPTRGIDVGAKREIYKIVHSLAEEGHAIILISDELQEVLGLSDKIVVMREGIIKGIVNKKGASQQKILSLAYGEV